jgi:hypothetical protein
MWHTTLPEYSPKMVWTFQLSQVAGNLVNEEMVHQQYCANSPAGALALLCGLVIHPDPVLGDTNSMNQEVKAPSCYSSSSRQHIQTYQQVEEVLYEI